MSKIFVFGIDGSTPSLVFEEWINDLPTIRSLMSRGAYARLNSTIPPSTITAWSSMVSGKDPSEIGIFSFTYKDKNGETKIVDSRNVKCERLWDILTKQGKRSVVLYVPLTYPVNPEQLNGVMVSCFLSLGLNEKSVYPAELKERIERLGDSSLFFDVAVGLGRHKALDIGTLLKRTYEMTEMQIKLVKELIKNEEWDFFMSVMIGTDRLQHMLWRHFDKTHRRYIRNSRYKNALKEYYIYLDKQLAEIIKLLPEDVVIIVASDHGMIKQEGKINLNNWLIEKGYLVLKQGTIKKISNNKIRFQFDFVDIGKTKVYAAGAYNARLFLNKGVLGEDYHNFREKLIKELKEITDDKGNKLNTQIYKKEDIYRIKDSPDCPDLTVYFDDLRWASNPDLGIKGLYSWGSAVGADSAGHSKQGIFIISGPGIPKKGDLREIGIEQITPTILNLLGVKKPKDITSEPIKVGL